MGLDAKRLGKSFYKEKDFNQHIFLCEIYSVMRILQQGFIVSFDHKHVGEHLTLLENPFTT